MSKEIRELKPCLACGGIMRPIMKYHPAYCDNGRFDKGWNACLDMILENALSDSVD